MNTREIIEKVRKDEKAPKTVVEAANIVKKSVMNIKRNDVNVNLYHHIVLHDVCNLIQCCKDNYRDKGGYIVIEIPDDAEIPGSVALGCAIGLMMDWLRIFEVPVYDIEFPNQENWEFDEEDEDEEYLRECKKDAKNSINQYRLLQVRFLVSAVCKTLGIDFEY